MRVEDRPDGDEREQYTEYDGWLKGCVTAGMIYPREACKGNSSACASSYSEDTFVSAADNGVSGFSVAAVYFGEQGDHPVAGLSSPFIRTP